MRIGAEGKLDGRQWEEGTVNVAPATGLPKGGKGTVVRQKKCTNGPQNIC